MGSPATIIGLVGLLVGIICLNSYFDNYRHRLTLKQLTTNIAMLKTVQAKPGEDLSAAVSESLKQLQSVEKNTEKLDKFSQFASIFILIGSILLGFVFYHNLSSFSYKLDRLSKEIKHISQGSYMDEYYMDYPLSGEIDNEIDNLAVNIEQILRNFKHNIREKNGALNLLKKSNQELKLKIKERA
jgi:methyl-accepting chemotaxis protein